MEYRECDARAGKRWLDAVSFSWGEGGMDGGDRVWVVGGRTVGWGTCTRLDLDSSKEGGDGEGVTHQLLH